jgi:hypothetical protein
MKHKQNFIALEPSKNTNELNATNATNETNETTNTPATKARESLTAGRGK